jgi:hypothetical protein
MELNQVISKVNEKKSNTDEKKYLNLSVFRAVNQLTVFIPTTAQ